MIFLQHILEPIRHFPRVSNTTCTSYYFGSRACLMIRISMLTGMVTFQRLLDDPNDFHVLDIYFFKVLSLQESFALICLKNYASDLLLLLFLCHQTIRLITLFTTWHESVITVAKINNFWGFSRNVIPNQRQLQA